MFMTASNTLIANFPSFKHFLPSKTSPHDAVATTAAGVVAAGGGGAGARPRTAAAEAVAKKKREMKESQEEAAMELLAHFNHRYVNQSINQITTCLIACH